MFKSLAVVLFAFLIYSNARAVNVQDTVIKTKPRSQAWFHLKYGKDDTSKAIIDYFFLKRKKTVAPLLVFSGIYLSIGIAALLSEGSAIREPDSKVGLSLAALIIAPVTIFFLFEYIKYSRRELIRTLQRYQSGKGVPKWLQRISSWKKFLNHYR